MLLDAAGVLLGVGVAVAGFVVVVVVSATVLRLLGFVLGDADGSPGSDESPQDEDPAPPASP